MQMQVQPLHVFSSRKKQDHPEAQSRCFHRMLLCRLEHPFIPDIPPNDPANVSCAACLARCALL